MRPSGVLASFWFAYCCAASTEDPMSEVAAKTQTLALYDWFSATGMEQLGFDWFSSASNVSEHDYCRFAGVTCDDLGFVTALDLNRSGLVGTIPDLRLLYRLTRLQASGNFLTGTLPDTLFEMASLQSVFLNENYLLGPLPPLPASSPLKRFLVARNGMTGTIPKSICNAKNLTSFDLSHNLAVRGTIPECLSSLNITRLRIDGASLTGTVPSGLCTLRDMNGLTPNTYGCDGVGCGQGFYQKDLGRQYGPDPCLKCSIPSNVLGSTRCRWFDGQVGEGNASHAPSFAPGTETSSPLITVYPSVSPMSPSRISSQSPSSPFFSPSRSPNEVQGPTSNAASQSFSRREHSVIVATVLVGVAFVGVLFSLLFQSRKRKKRRAEVPPNGSKRSSVSDEEVLTLETAEGAEILTKVSSFENSSTKPQTFDHSSVLSQALDSGSIRIRNRAASNEKRVGILRPASMGKSLESNDPSETQYPSQTARKVRFDVPLSLSYSPDSLDFLSSDSSIVDEDQSCNAPSDRIDPETWATWIIDGAVPDSSPTAPPSADNGGAWSPTSLPSAPLLPHEQAPLDWERFGAMASRPLGSCHMFPFKRSKCDDVGSRSEQGKSTLAEAFRCGWLRDDDLDSIATTPFGFPSETRPGVAEEAKDAEEAHAEI